MNISFKVIAKSSKTKFYTEKEFLALIFILKLRGVYNLFSHVYVFSFFFFLESINIKRLFFEQSLAGFEQGSLGLEQCSANYLGSNRILRGSWPHAPRYCIQTIIDTTKLVDTIFNYNYYDYKDTCRNFLNLMYFMSYNYNNCTILDFRFALIFNFHSYVMQVMHS